MGADIKSLRNRIKSVDSTLHLTKAMGLVASSKIKKATENMIKGRQYSLALEDAVKTLAQSSECKKSPYLKANNSDKICLVVIAFVIFSGKIKFGVDYCCIVLMMSGGLGNIIDR